eukprot:3744940-Prorocentrum_lima.AAC.1
MTSSLVGSEMCIRDRSSTMMGAWLSKQLIHMLPFHPATGRLRTGFEDCLLYTSDAADDMP